MVELYDWSRICLVSPKQIIHNAEYRNRPTHETTVVHSGGRGMIRYGPETENKHGEEVDASKRIDDSSPGLRDSPRAPGQGLSVDGVRESLVVGRVWLDTPSDSSIKEESVSDQIGSVEPIYTKGDDVVESDSGAQANEGKQDGNNHGEGDGHYWKGSSGLNLNDT